MSKTEGRNGKKMKKLSGKIMNKLMLVLALSNFAAQPIAAFASEETTATNEISEVIDTTPSEEQTDAEMPVDEYLAQNDYTFSENGKLKSTNGTDVREDLKEVLSVLEERYGYRTSSLTRGASDVYIDADYNIKSVS